mmetsp:Transcript_7730/g.28382  ORF Transcript_7730/g.28382 Transcript_7730/m.28382 type:complete len:292 (-) Transcript_7730:156-1031(-)
MAIVHSSIVIGPPVRAPLSASAVTFANAIASPAACLMELSPTFDVFASLAAAAAAAFALASSWFILIFSSACAASFRARYNASRAKPPGRFTAPRDGSTRFRIVPPDVVEVEDGVVPARLNRTVPLGPSSPELDSVTASPSSLIIFALALRALSPAFSLVTPSSAARLRAPDVSLFKPSSLCSSPAFATDADADADDAESSRAVPSRLTSPSPAPSPSASLDARAFGCPRADPRRSATRHRTPSNLTPFAYALLDDANDDDDAIDRIVRRTGAAPVDAPVDAAYIIRSHAR